MHWGALLTIIRCVASSGLSRIAVLSGCPFTWVIVFCAPTDQRTGKDDPVPSESDRAAAVGAVHRDRMRRLADGWPRFRAAGFAMRIVGSGGVFGMLLGSVGRVEHDAVVACCELDFGDAFAARRFRMYAGRGWPIRCRHRASTAASRRLGLHLGRGTTAWGAQRRWRLMRSRPRVGSGSRSCSAHRSIWRPSSPAVANRVWSCDCSST